MYRNYDANGAVKNIGVDMCDIRRFEKMRFEIMEKFACRILAEEELLEYSKSKNKPKTLAVYFCAKECTAKVLGTGFCGIFFQDIMLKKDELGKPVIYLSEKASAIADKAGINSIKISITHEKNFVIAFAAAT